MSWAAPPARSADRQPRARGRELAGLVPNEATLYLSRVKDEGVLFYYGRPARRLANFDRLPSAMEPYFCLLTDEEWRTWNPALPAQNVASLTDAQGDPLVLARFARHEKTLSDP